MDQKPGIRSTPIADLTLHPDNPRHGDIGAIMQSIEQNGFVGVLVAQCSTGHVITGNHRMQAAANLGFTKLKVEWKDCSDEEALRLLLADNRTSDLATNDDVVVADLLMALAESEAGFDGTGYDGDDLDDIIASLEYDLPPAEEEQEPPAPPANPITKPGDLILLGEHRLICGDATDPEAYKQILDGPADLVWTDPPYGVSYVGGTKDALTIKNDDINPTQLNTLIRSAFTAALPNTRPGGAWFVAHPGGPLHVVFGTILNDLGILRQQLIWIKNSLVLGRSDYHYRHEPIYYGWAPGAAHQEPPDRTHDTIFEIDRPTVSKLHPTMKPVELIEPMIRNHTITGNLILDPFAGSGSTLIAADNLNRRAALIELDPGYCDVIVQRWENHTGQTATRP